MRRVSDKTVRIFFRQRKLFLRKPLTSRNLYSPACRKQPLRCKDVMPGLLQAHANMPPHDLVALTLFERCVHLVLRTLRLGLPQLWIMNMNSNVCPVACICNDVLA